MELLHSLAEIRTPLLDTIFLFISYLAKEPLVFAFLIWLYWCQNKKLARTLGFSYFFSGFLVQGIKVIVRVDRPWVLDPEFKPVEKALPEATGYSFPSGHTQAVTVLGTIGALHLRQVILKILSIALILVLGFSRMYLGCHTLADVLTAFLLTFSCTVLCYYLFYMKDFFESHPGAVCIVLALFSIALPVLAIILTQRTPLTDELAMDCYKVGGAGLAFAIGLYIENRFVRFEIPDTIGRKILRALIGIAVAAVFFILPKKLLPATTWASFLRYFVTIFWVIALYPLIFVRFSRKQEAGGQAS